MTDFDISFYHKNEDRHLYEPTRLVRRYINSAVYIETDAKVCGTAPYQQSQLRSCRSSSEDIPKYVVVKTCTCATTKERCPVHSGSSTTLDFKQFDLPKANPSKVSIYTNASKSCSEMTAKNEHSSVNDKSSAPNSESSSNSCSSAESLEEQKPRDSREAFKAWLAEKNRQRKEDEERKERIEAERKKEREEMLRMDRQSFVAWLKRKKQEEEAAKTGQGDKHVQIEELQCVLEEKRRLERELHFRLWLKRKEEQELAKKCEEQMKIVKSSEEKMRRQEESRKAYGVWLEKSKYKAKPLPLNKGLQSKFLEWFLGG